MKLNDLDDIWGRLRKKPWQTIIFCIVLLVSCALVLWASGYLGERGRQSAIDSSMEQMHPYRGRNGVNPRLSEEVFEEKIRLPQTTTELVSHLYEQINFIQRSAKYFDNGHREEAKRIATSLRILLHGSHNLPSLFAQLRIIDNLHFVDTAYDDRPGNLVPYIGLVMLEVSSKGGSYTAPLGNLSPLRRGKPPLSFDKWWNAIIIDDRKGHRFARKTLVLRISDQDGGSNIDPTLDPDYVALSRQNTLGWTAKGNKPIHGAELHQFVK